MTGPEHFKRAEDCLTAALDSASQDTSAEYMQAAQVHATLALTLATLDSKGASAQVIRGAEWRTAIERGSETVNA